MNQKESLQDFFKPKKKSNNNNNNNNNNSSDDDDDDDDDSKKQIKIKRVISKGLPKKIKLVEARSDRMKFDNLSDLYSVIVAVEHLETAFIRDSISAEDYTEACKKLISQFKTLKESTKKWVPSVKEFMKDYGLNDCSAAENRLLKIGVPATVEHGGSKKPGSGKEELYVFQAVQYFITTMDSLKLEMRAVDELHPHLSDIIDNLNTIKDLPPDHIAVVNVKKWLVTLNSMKAHDELNEEQARQLSFDLEAGYSKFHKFLQERVK